MDGDFWKLCCWGFLGRGVGEDKGGVNGGGEGKDRGEYEIEQGVKRFW